MEVGSLEAASKSKDPSTLPYSVRPMIERDVAQSAEIERDAFPTLFPPTAFRREFRKPTSRYLVATSSNGAFRDLGIPSGKSSVVEAFADRVVSKIWRGRDRDRKSDDDFLAGFIGIWYMVDEAHIVSIGVRRQLRGLGIGELMLIAAIEQAKELNSRVVTLEVRISNFIAQNLYKKFGFTTRGIRKGYYTDNREDALIMTTEPFDLPIFNEQFNSLVQAHLKRWGIRNRTLS